MGRPRGYRTRRGVLTDFAVEVAIPAVALCTLGAIAIAALLL